MKIRTLVLARHCRQAGGVNNSALSDAGRDQAENLARQLKNLLAGQSFAVITSEARRAQETAMIVTRELGGSPARAFVKLWADNDHHYDDQEALHIMLGEGREVEVLVVVAHLEFVTRFPRYVIHQFNLGCDFPTVREIPYGGGWVINLIPPGNCVQLA